MATLLLTTAYLFFTGKITENVNVGLILASNVKDRFRFEISAQNSCREPYFNQISPKIRDSEGILEPKTKCEVIFTKFGG